VTVAAESTHPPQPTLAPAVRAALEREAARRLCGRRHASVPALQPMLAPVLPALAAAGYRSVVGAKSVQRVICEGAAHLGTDPRSWTAADWVEVRQLFAGVHDAVALTVCAVRGYEVRTAPGDGLLVGQAPQMLARRLFGPEAVAAATARLHEAIRRIGYQGGPYVERVLATCISDLMLRQGTGTLEALTDETVAMLSAALDKGGAGSRPLMMVSAGLAELGILRTPIERRKIARTMKPEPVPGAAELAPEWVDWCRRWRALSLLSPNTRSGRFSELLRAGRWLAMHHSSITAPAAWTAETALAYARYIEDARIGDFAITEQTRSRAGEPLGAQTRSGALTSVRGFFLDLQGWGLIEPRFSPVRCLATPRVVLRALRANPRPIENGHWLKLRAAALTLRLEDLPLGPKGQPNLFYLLAMIRAAAAALMFSGCRSDEIARFEVGCVHVESISEHTDPRTSETVPGFAQTMLRVPVCKTSGEFVKPVEAPLAEAIAGWERVRPSQRPLPDRLTGRLTHHLFCNRGRRVGAEFFNTVLIPTLLRKSGLPRSDALGPITSHRMRATLATRLYDHGSGLSPIEVMQWLGHASLSSGRHYIKLTPIRLMASFHRGARLTQAVRTVAALVDTQPAAGDPVVRYDLGHGWCTNDAYALCQHRMACARCSFYEPAAEFAETLRRQRSRFVRMLQELELTEDERTAIDGDAAAVGKLLDKLAGKPTPDMGEHPHESV
jgi:integrase